MSLIIVQILLRFYSLHIILFYVQSTYIFLVNRKTSEISITWEKCLWYLLCDCFCRNDHALATKILCDGLDKVRVSNKNEYCELSEQLSSLKELKYDGTIRGRRNVSMFLQSSLKRNLRFKPFPLFKDSALKNITMGINLPVCTLNTEEPFEENPRVLHLTWNGFLRDVVSKYNNNNVYIKCETYWKM